MGRKLLMVLLGVGAVAGFAAGFSRMCHGPFAHHGFGPGGYYREHHELEQRVADTCTESALRVYERKSPPGPKP